MSSFLFSNSKLIIQKHPAVARSLFIDFLSAGGGGEEEDRTARASVFRIKCLCRCDCKSEIVRSFDYSNEG